MSGKQNFIWTLIKDRNVPWQRVRKKKELKLLIFYTVNLNLNKEKFQLCSTNKYFPVQCLSKKTELWVFSVYLWRNTQTDIEMNFSIAFDITHLKFFIC